MTENPMVPSTDWGRASKAFSEGLGHTNQVILCARCVIELGLTTPPDQVVILAGESYCLDHLPRAETR